MTNENERLYRVIDANLNRLKEGLRVVEDIQRYVYDNTDLAPKIKELRHLCAIPCDEFIKFRDIQSDILKTSTKSEQTRKSISDIITANCKRAQESARVLEECFKLINLEYSERFKLIRYELYDLQKNFNNKFKTFFV